MINFELVIFDMDGLMFDTERIALDSWKKAATFYNHEIHEDILYEVIGTNLNKTKEIFVKRYGDIFPIDDILKKRFDMAEEVMRLQGVPIKDGLIELIDFLKKENKKIAVATSTSMRRAKNLLNMAGVLEKFDYILCGDEISNSKPHPEIFLKVAEKLNCNPEKCIVLEDSEPGIMAAYEANMIPILIVDIKEPKDEIKKLAYKSCNSLNEVKEILSCN